MIKFHDPAGTPHFGQATITRTTSVNGGLSLTGEVFAGGDVLNGLDYGWWLNFDNEKYVITYKKLSDDTNTVVFDAVQQFFWDFAKVALHAQYTGSHEYTFYLGQLFDKSGYTYKNDVTVPAFEKENWGYKNKLDLFNDIIDQAGVEFEVHNETVHIAKQIGSDLTSFARKGINLSDLTEEMKISDFATYAKGYGAFKDAENQSKGRLEVEYRSELAKQFGDLEMDPIVDERYTIADNLIAALKKQVDATYTVSMTMNIYDLENAGYPNYEAPKVGDWILAIDEALNFKRKIRIIQLEEQFDVTGKRIGYTATCGDLSIVDQYTHLQSSLDSRVQRIQKSVDDVAISANGKSSNYYGAKEPIGADEGDLWFDQSNSDPDKWSIKQWVNGRWEQLTLNPGEISDKVASVRAEAESAVEKAEQLATKYDDTNSLASQAFDRATSAQSEAGSAIAKAESTASEFGNVSQKTDSAFDNAMSAQSAASTAVTQASSAAADSKDAKQIAGAVSQSYKTLTDGSTMTIAELENGLAVKLTKSDLDGYATEAWTQNQIQVSADGINGTMSSIKNTVDGQTTSINDLKADSSSFKSQFTTVNDTLGKQTTDIGSLQATSKELTSGFNTLTTDNKTNKNDISQLKQTATEVSSTLETVQTQVQDSAVGTNLLTGTDKDISITSHTTDGWPGWVNIDTGFSFEHGKTYTFSAEAKNSTDKIAEASIRVWESSTNAQVGVYAFPADGERHSVTITIPNDSHNYHLLLYAGRAGIVPGVDVTTTYHHPKLEKGSLATDWCLNPSETATVTAVSKLSQTVDGVKTDISRKIERTDLNGYATQDWTNNQISITANGINGTISSVKSTVDGHTTSINDLKADSSSFKNQFTTVNNTLGKHTTDIGTLQASAKSLSANFDSLSSDNKTNQHNISQLQASAGTFNSTLMTVQQRVTDSAVGTNLYRSTRDLDNPNGIWNRYGSWTKTGEIYNGMTAVSTTQDWNGLSQTWAVKKGETYTFSIYAKYESGTGNSNLYCRGIDNLTTTNTDISAKPVSLNGTWQRVFITFVVTADGYVCPRLERTTDNTNKLIVAGPKLERGSIMTDYSTSPLDNATVTAVSSISQTVDHIETTVRGKVDNDTFQSKITQLNDLIDLRVEKDGVVNAINVTPERIKISGNKLWITADTYIDNAIIKNSMIESINAEKITAGTIDADKIQVIHLNADNITTGSIHGSNLDINLNTGNVEFQKGRIHSADNTIDINIDSKYISVADGNNRILLSGGQLQMIQPNLYSPQATPYFRLTNEGAGSSFSGATMWSKDYIVMTVQHNDQNIFSSPTGPEEFAGISAGHSNLGWQATQVGGADRGIFLSGGQTFPYGVNRSPFITIGAKDSSGVSVNGSRVVVGADYFHIYPTHTSSHAANVYMGSDGAIVQSTSAAKYKTDIVRTFETQMGDKLLEVPVAHWKDKEEVLAKTLDPDAKNPETYFGMIADDLDDAGLNELVEYDDKGSVRGIQYDRVALALIPLIRNYRDRITELETEVKEMKEV